MVNQHDINVDNGLYQINVVEMEDVVIKVVKN